MPTDKATAATEGRTVWQLDMKPWTEQIDELVYAGRYSDALALLDTLEEAVLPDKVGQFFPSHYHSHDIAICTPEFRQQGAPIFAH